MKYFIFYRSKIVEHKMSSILWKRVNVAEYYVTRVKLKLKLKEVETTSLWMEFARRIDRDREPFALFVARFSLLRVHRSRSSSVASKEAAGIIFIEIDRRSIRRIAGNLRPKAKRRLCPFLFHLYLSICDLKRNLKVISKEFKALKSESYESRAQRSAAHGFRV